MKHVFRHLTATLLFLSGFFGLYPQVCMAFDEEYPEVYEVDGIIYKLFTNDEIPLKVEVIGINDKFTTTPELILPEELIIDVHHWYVEGPTPAEIVKIGHSAFKECKKFSKVKLPSTVRIIADSAFYKSTLSAIELPEGLVSIGDWAFSSSISPGSVDVRKATQTIKIPESVRYLGFNCMSPFTLKAVEFPATFERFEGRTFMNSYVKDIYFYSETPPASDGTDFGIMGDNYVGPIWDCCMGPAEWGGTIHVPAKSLELYKSTFPYNCFFYIVAIEEDEPNDDDDPAQSGIEEADNDNPAYSVENGELSVSCRAGDTIFIYDAGGVLLDKRTFTSPTRYIHRGHGFRLLKINDDTHKIAL